MSGPQNHDLKQWQTLLIPENCPKWILRVSKICIKMVYSCSHSLFHVVWKKWTLPSISSQFQWKSACKISLAINSFTDCEFKFWLTANGCYINCNVRASINFCFLITNGFISTVGSSPYNLLWTAGIAIQESSDLLWRFDTWICFLAVAWQCHSPFFVYASVHAFVSQFLGRATASRIDVWHPLVWNVLGKCPT